MARASVSLVSIKSAEDFTSRGSDLALENVNVDRAIASVYVRFLLKRDRDARLLRKWGGRGQKRDNNKDRGKREMHLVQSKAELVKPS